MELKIKEVTFPEVIEFNFEELKQEITNRVEMYKTLVYTDEQIKSAKEDRANLRKFVDALEAERKAVKKQCLQPYEAFESKVKELLKIVNEPVALIDKQVKEYEEKKKIDKKDEIVNFFNSCTYPEWLKFEQIFDEKWLNSSVSMKSVKETIDARLEQIEKDIAMLSSLPEFGFEAVEVYKTTLDVNKAVYEANRMSQIAKAKAEAEAKKAEEEFSKNMNPPVTEVEQETTKEVVTVKPKQWVKFKAKMTVEEAYKLKQFFTDNNIEFEAI